MKLVEAKLKFEKHHLVWGDVAKFRFEAFLPIYLSALELSNKSCRNSLSIWDKGCPTWLDSHLTVADKLRLNGRHKVTFAYSDNGIDFCLTEDWEDKIMDNGLKTLRIEFELKPLHIKSVFFTYVKEMSNPESLARLLECCE